MEDKLWNEKRKKELYAIMNTTEKLETVFATGVTISSNDYVLESCITLIVQFKTLAFTLKDILPNIQRIVNTCKSDRPADVNRLVTSGESAATVEHVELIVDTYKPMDAVKLNNVGVDQVYHVLLDSLTKLRILLDSLTESMEKWTGKLSQMRAHQLLLDLKSLYCSFMDALLVAAGTKLWNDKHERELHKLISATEKLENTFACGTISSNDYHLECCKLLAHFKTLAFNFSDNFPKTEQISNTYKFDYPAALNRLVTSGMPATVEHRRSIVTVGRKYGVNFIAAMDAVKLNIVVVHEVYPVFSDLLDSLTKLKKIIIGRRKIKKWIRKLSKMEARDELTKEQAQQLVIDVGSLYNSFIDAMSADAGPDC